MKAAGAKEEGNYDYIFPSGIKEEKKSAAPSNSNTLKRRSAPQYSGRGSMGAARVSSEADDYKEKACSVHEGRSPPASAASSQEYETKRAAPAASPGGAGDVPPSVDGEPITSSPWVDLTLVCIHNARHHVAHCQKSISLTLPNSFETNISHLRRIRTATLDLLNCTDDVISSLHATQSLQRQTALKQELASVQKQLTQAQCRYAASLNMLRDAKSELDKQKADTQSKMAALVSLHTGQKTRLLEEQQALERQLKDEREKSVCRACRSNPRDTIVLPCLHFQYCFGCLLRHREANGNTCPLCRVPIQGINMLSSLAG
ncbi:hypothetical protein L7F22_049942 [Adiantum nelumboides]|nr:hypothetical protein [Adiantum nelumboides]